MRYAAPIPNVESDFWKQLTDRPPSVKFPTQMVDVAQLVRASDCGSESRGFESRLPP